VKVISEAKYMVERYFTRLSKFSRLNQEAIKMNRQLYKRLSYKEIANIVSYLDHREASSFRRISRNSNYSACYAILNNLREFEGSLNDEQQLAN